MTGSSPPLTAEQQAALTVLLQAVERRGEAALVGPAGSGKSTVIRALLAKIGLDRVLALAPTHQALSVLRRGLPDGVALATTAAVLRMRPRVDAASGRLEFAPSGGARDPMTLRALQGFDQPPAAVIVDEASMLGTTAVQSLERICRKMGWALLLVGDPAQLPPIDAGRCARQLTHDYPQARLSVVMRTGNGPVLALSEAIRTTRNLMQVWPTASRRGAESEVILHPNQAAWLDAAATVIGSAEWRHDPSLARIVCWSNAAADRFGAELRRRQWGDQADRWHPGEWLGLPNGISPEGDALGYQLAPASSEGQLLEVGAPEPLHRHAGSFTWRTPVRQTLREVAIEASTTACRCRIAVGGSEHSIWLETPDALGSWNRQVRALQNAAKKRICETDPIRAEVFRAILDLSAWCPRSRFLGAGTVHIAQGSTLQRVWVAADISWSGSEQISLAYVGVSRAQTAVHVTPLWSRKG